MMQRSTAVKMAKIVISLALLLAIVLHVGPGLVAGQLEAMDKSLVLVALALLVIESLVRALNWYQLIRSGSRQVSLKTVVYAHFVGGFFGALLPSTLGTDMARSAVATTRSKISVEVLLATTVLLNILSIAVIAALAVVACFWVINWPEAPRRTIMVSAAVSGALLLLVFFLGSQAKRRGPVFSTDFEASTGWGGRLKKRMRQFVEALVILPRGRKLGAVSVIAALSYGLRTLGWLVLLAAAGVHISWIVLLTIGPLLTVGAALPISVLGFGGFQAISLVLLAQWGVPPQQALAVSLVQSALAVLLHSIGCFAYLNGGRNVYPVVTASERAEEKYSG